MHCLVHVLKFVFADPRRLVYGYQFVQNVALDRLTSFNKRCQKRASPEIIISYFEVIYGNFHMLYFGTHTFSLILFAFVKCIFYFPFLWVWKSTGNKAHFKSYICYEVVHCLVHVLKCILANPKRFVYGYQFVQNVALDRLTSFNKHSQKRTFSEIIISYFEVIYGNFHMFYFGTHTFSLIVFAFVKCIFCFPFLWVWKGTGNKACSFKSYICCSILNYS